MKLLPNQSKLYPNTDRYKRLVGKMNYIAVDYIVVDYYLLHILRESLLYISYFCIPLCNAS